MIIYFKKGYNKDKPKRWYIFGKSPCKTGSTGFYEVDSDIPLTIYAWSAELALKNKLAEIGIKAIRDKKLLRWQNKQFFVYFRSHADEAEFIMKYSNGVGIDL